MTLEKQLQVKGWAQEGPGPPAFLEFKLGQGGGKRLISHLPAGKEGCESCRANLTALPSLGAAEQGLDRGQAWQVRASIGKPKTWSGGSCLL